MNLMALLTNTKEFIIRVRLFLFYFRFAFEKFQFNNLSFFLLLFSGRYVFRYLIIVIVITAKLYII